MGLERLVFLLLYFASIKTLQYTKPVMLSSGSLSGEDQKLIHSFWVILKH